MRSPIQSGIDNLFINTMCLELESLEAIEKGRKLNKWWGVMVKDRRQKLEVWKHADELAFQVYNATRHFPKEEIYGITSQIRRASLSIPTNTVEGYSYMKLHLIQCPLGDN
jgi:hypothetical protein